MIMNNNPSTSKAFIEYKQIMERMMKRLIPQLSHQEFERAINYSINKRFKNSECSLNNNYKEKSMNTNLLRMTEYILDRRPILTSYGCLFTRHGEVPNPLYQMIQDFVDTRSAFKKKMFQYPKGSEEFNKYNLLQLVAKVDVNAIYGCLGAATSLFYNIYVATSITKQGRCAISTSIMFFESFLRNNIKFGSLNEIITFIDHIIEEKKERKFFDKDILDENVRVEDVFAKLMMGCGYNWFPDETDCEMVWNILNTLSQEDLNRIYYKNNLYEFFKNGKVSGLLVNILRKLDTPFLDPNSPPKEIEEDLLQLVDLVYEFVYYHYMIIDKTERVEVMPREAVLITDTDSCIITLEPWYQFVKKIVENIDLKIKRYELDSADIVENEDINEVQGKELKDYYYDFYNEKLVERKRLINPMVLIPEDGVRYSIINILAFTIGKLLNDYMKRLAAISNVTNDAHPFCLLSMKNEFLFKKVLLTNVKKNYVTLQEIQEGHAVPKDKQLDIKGLALRKSGVPQSTTKELSRILYEDILNCETIDQNKILNELAVMERKICDSIRNNSVEYFKPQRIRSQVSYESPMRIQGIKAATAYNAVKDASDPAINLDEKNSILIVKTNITKSSLEYSDLKTRDPKKYEAMKGLLNTEFYKDGIKSIAIPTDIKTPKWLFEFIDYQTIVRDNIGVFPIEPLGMTKMNTNSAYSTILKL